jgi:hypothetical protein
LASRRDHRSSDGDFERFWTAVRARDAAVPGSPERVVLEDRVNRLAVLLVDLDGPPESPSAADQADRPVPRSGGADGQDPAGVG